MIVVIVAAIILIVVFHVNPLLVAALAFVILALGVVAAGSEA